VNKTLKACEMTELFDGLLLYEITLLMLGVLLFLILSIGLLFYIIKKEQIKKLFFFFIFPIIMIGYPSIKEVSISKDRFTLTKYQEEYMENPEDSLAKKKVEEFTAKLEDRASSPEDIVQISKSYLLLGENKKASSLADKALDKDGTTGTANEEARDIKKLAEVQERLRVSPLKEESRPAVTETKPAEETAVRPAETETSGSGGETATRPSTTLIDPSTVLTNPSANLHDQLTAEASSGEEGEKEEEKPLLEVNPKFIEINDVEVTKNLSKVKSFLLKRTIRNSETESEPNR
jgi:hypothetical protein